MPEGGKSSAGGLIRPSRSNSPPSSTRRYPSSSNRVELYSHCPLNANSGFCKIDPRSNLRFEREQLVVIPEVMSPFSVLFICSSSLCEGAPLGRN